MKAGPSVLLLTLAACAGTPPQEESTSADEQYREADARIRATEELARMRASCARAGGVVVVRNHWATRLPRSNMGGAGTATCETFAQY